MIKFYYNLSPNPAKVALLLEELGLPYETVPIDVRNGDQFDPSFTALNPNSKVPCIVDGDTTVFDSNAILLYYAEQTGRFLSPARAELLSWLMYVATGVGPYSGQAVHFRNYAPPSNEYARTRYAFEADRHYRILDTRLADHRFMLGDDYTIVDMAVWGWSRMVPFIFGDDTAWTRYPNLERLTKEVGARPAAQRALALKERHTFSTAKDDTALHNMFRHLTAPV